MDGSPSNAAPAALQLPEPGNACRAVTRAGTPCRSPRVQQGDRCFWHSTDYAAKAAEARRRGGEHRRRKKVIADQYPAVNLSTVAGIREIAEIAVADALALENSIGRSRVLIAGAAIGAKLLGDQELEAR